MQFMHMLNEFKKFILKGNVIDLSTGVIIGAAFGNIVTAFTKGIVEPILAIFGGGANPQWKIPIWEKTNTIVRDGETVKQTVPVLMDLGAVVGATIGFLITAAVVFFVIIKPMNKLMTLMKQPDAPLPPAVAPPDVVLLTEIRDLLKGGAAASGTSAAAPKPAEGV